MIKRVVFLFVLITGCVNNKPVNYIELYGNTFIEIGCEDFQAPNNWESKELFNKSIKIKLPSYMKQVETREMGDDYSCAIYMYRDSTNMDDYHYGRVSIDYYFQPQGGFFLATDRLSSYDQEQLLAPIVKKALGGGQIAGNYMVPDGEILNGPFFESHLIFDDENKYFYVNDAFYRRNGHTANKGPVSCHIYYLMNKTEAVLMAISYHDTDSILFDNLFNVVKTFKWSEIHK